MCLTLSHILDGYFEILNGLELCRIFFSSVVRIKALPIIINRKNSMQIEGIKQEAYRILDQLPDKAIWDDLMHQIYIRQTIKAGIKNSDEGRT